MASASPMALDVRPFRSASAFWIVEEASPSAVVRRAVREQAALAGAEVDRLWMVGDDRQRRLLGLGGVPVCDAHPDPLEAEQLLDLQVL